MSLRFSRWHQAGLVVIALLTAMAALVFLITIHPIKWRSGDRGFRLHTGKHPDNLFAEAGSPVGYFPIHWDKFWTAGEGQPVAGTVHALRIGRLWAWLEIVEYPDRDQK